MFPHYQRHSCDRCRRQKVRCPKNYEPPTATFGAGNNVTPCERCTKAGFACVYSLRRSNKRSKGKEAVSPRGNPHSSRDVSSASSHGDVTGYDFDSLFMSSLDTTIPSLDDGDAYSWDNNFGLAYTTDRDNGTQEITRTSTTTSRGEDRETSTAQLIKLSNCAMGATQELECAVITIPVTIQSRVVNDAFEATSTLVRIVNSIPLRDSTYGSSQLQLSRDESERQSYTDYNPIFLALASHQHVLILFRAICDSIKRSLGSEAQGSESQQSTLHGAGSSAQFILVLQLIIHLLKRIGRSFRVGSPKDIDQRNGRESGSSQGIVESAQVMLRTLPNEHVKLCNIVQELQGCIEEGVTL